MVLALQHGVAPRSCIWTKPSSHVIGKAVPSSCSPRKRCGRRPERPPGGGVAFRVSGTNAHVILEQAPSAGTCEQRAGQVQRRCRGSSRPRHRGRCRRRSTGSQRTPGPLCPQWTSGTHRHRSAALAHRAVLLATRRGRARSGSDSVQEQPRQNRVPVLRPGLAADRHGTRAVPAVRCVRRGIRRGVGASDVLLDQQIRDIMWATTPGCWSRHRYTQPALSRSRRRCSAWLASWGVRPDCLPGIRNRRDHRGPCRRRAVPRGRLTLVAARGRLMDELPPGGRWSRSSAEDEVTGFLDGRVSVAAVTGRRRSCWPVRGPRCWLIAAGSTPRAAGQAAAGEPPRSTSPLMDRCWRVSPRWSAG